MSFRRKLLILLLVIALVPLLINGLLHRTTMRRISQQLTTDTREALQKNATNQLLTLVNHQSLLLKRDRIFILQSILAQARDVENLLANQNSPTDAELEEAYLAVQRLRPDLFLWHATFLDSGQNSVFPREALSANEQAVWRNKTKRTKTIDWQLDFVNSHLQITFFSPVRSPDGELAGITSFGLDYQQLFRDWQLPHPWQEQSRLFVASIGPATSTSQKKLNILLEIVDQSTEQTSVISPEKLFQSMASISSINTLIEKAEPNRSGFLTTEFDNKETIWIYATSANGEPFPLLLVPRKLVSLPANQAADYVEDQFISGLKLTALLSFGVLLWAIITAIFRARAVTKPLADLAQAGELLSQGDFSAHVNISSNDEFEELGKTFNRIGPQLRERQEIKQALAVARDIQLRILPASVPILDNFEIAARLDYCDETGGDYYDFIKTDSGKWGLAVGDVVGHGVGAALLMTSAAGILHAAIASGQENLETLFSSLNTFLEKDVGDTRFMTLFFGLLDPTAGTLHWLSAGHGPMLLYRAATKSVEELPATTMPLGVMDDVEFKPIHEETFSSGDMLAIGTDGIWETSNPSGEMFGIERFGRLLTEQAQQSADKIVSEILLAVEEFRGEAAKDDDVTLILLKAK